MSPRSVALQSGQSKQFTSAVTGTSNTAVTWTAVLGSISSSGVYTAPTLAGQAVDTISAVSTVDPTKYASASVTVSGNTSSANTFYVDPVNGSDSNNGTSQATAWQTLCKANVSATLGPNGTQIILLPGTFTLANQGSCYSSSGGLLLTLNGTATQRVVWQGENDPRNNSNSTVLDGQNASRPLRKLQLLRLHSARNHWGRSSSSARTTTIRPTVTTIPAKELPARCVSHLARLFTSASADSS